MGHKERTERTHRPLAELAGRQHGVVSTRQLAELGYSRSLVAKEAERGRLQRLHRGVYAVGYHRPSWHSRCLGAVFASAPAVASHTSAAWLWGLLRTAPNAIHLTASTRRAAKPGFEAQVHFASLTEGDCAERDDIPVTALPRTLLDLAALLPSSRLERVIERAEELRSFDLHAVEALLTRVEHHPGAGCLRRALAIYREDPAFERSKLEKRFRKLVMAAGLPLPSMNFNVAGFELDAYWERERFAVELDVYETHGSHAAFERDRLRQEDLKLAGVEMTRVTGPRLDREPDEVMRRVRALLAQRREQLGGN